MRQALPQHCECGGDGVRVLLPPPQPGCVPAVAQRGVAQEAADARE